MIRTEGMQPDRIVFRAMVLLLCSTWLTGCGDSAAPDADTASVPRRMLPSRPLAAESGQRGISMPADPMPAVDGDVENVDGGRQTSLPDNSHAESSEVPGDLIEVHDGASRWLPNLPRLEVDDSRALAAGIRKLDGRRIALFTDLEPSDEVDTLAKVFDLAFPQWCEYFGIDPLDHPDWKMTGFLMVDRSRFERAGLLPRRLPPFRNGFSWNYELWIYEQPSVYYRRHLLLHEGTHGFMNTILGGCGPPWYMEGVAELLSTHSWNGDRLVLNYMPESRKETPQWGRIKIVRDDFAALKARSVDGVLNYHPGVFLNNEPYGWSWALAAFLDGHPRYRERFRQIPKLIGKSDVTERFRRLIYDDWEELCDEWQVFVADLDYGYDVTATVVDFAPAAAVPEGGASVTVDAGRGWQNSGLRLDRGSTYRLAASGRYQLDTEPEIWWSEPGGVSIRYYKGQPMGILLAAVRVDPAGRSGACELIRPVSVGLGATLKPVQSGTLFLRINDSAGKLDDNVGSLTVEVALQADSN